MSTEKVSSPLSLTGTASVAVSSVLLKLGTTPTETACQPLARSGKRTGGAAVSGPAAIMVPATSSVSNDMVRQCRRLDVALSAVVRLAAIQVSAVLRQRC